MSLKDRSSPVSPGTVLSVFCLLLYSAGFIRIELKLNDHDQRLVAAEEVISQLLKQKMADRSSSEVLARTTQNKDNNAKLDRFRRVISSPSSSSNDSAYIREVLEDMFTSSLKICEKRGNVNVCPRGRPGPPGRAGTQGDQGRRGRKGSQGVMGQPGRSGKQGIMGPPGIRGEEGIKGDTGAPGIPGIKGEPGESISAPLATISPSKLTVNESNTASLLCSVSGNPAAQITWSRLNESLPSNRTKVTSEGLVQIVDVRLEDAGKYKCVARNILGKDEKVANLVVQSQPKIFLSLSPSYVEKDKNITLPTCHVTSYPRAMITWSKVHGELVQARAVLKDGHLSILNAQKKDSGLYKCKASNNLGHDSAFTQLVVVELPRFTVSPPAQLEVDKNQNITVPCQATGDPQPTVTWMKENGELPVGRSKVGVDGTLHIWNLKEKDAGKYTCMALSNNIFAKAISAMELTVKKDSCTTIKTVGSPVTHHTHSFTQGAWMKDPLGIMGTETIFVMKSYYAQKVVEEFENMVKLKAGVTRNTYTLPYSWDGTGAVVYGKYLYYNRANTKYIVKYNFLTSSIEAQITLSGYAPRKVSYQWGGRSGVDLAVDEKGLWVLWGNTADSNRLYASKIDGDVISHTYALATESMHSIGNAFVACGVIYCTDSYNSRSTTINFAYDTKTGKQWNPNIQFANQYGYNSMVDYNPREKVLYAWDRKRLVTYSITWN